MAGAVALLAMACGGASSGETVYRQVCASCHGMDGAGVAGSGRALQNNAWIQSHTDTEAVELILDGRPADHPENELGVDMPPRGGDPSLSHAEARAIVAYLRTLQP